MITQTGMLPAEPLFVDGSDDLWRVIGAATSATTAAVLLAYCFQPFITLAYLVFLLAG
jgi:anti-sigma-K factor RskA